jgi:peptidoglycan/LPS O-acetylase OafA/YrhL
MLGHVRNHVFPQYQAAAPPEFSFPHLIPWLGREAVMVFFVLSGFLVGGTLLRAIPGSTSLTRYYIARLTRLYVVMLPALLLFLAIGFAFQALLHDERSAALDSWRSLRIFAINLVFLQTIEGPTFANDYPLWSVANEFWYYVIFPLFLAAWWYRRQKPLQALVSAGFALGLVWFVGADIARYFSIWLLGAAAAWSNRPLARFGPALFIFVGTVLVSRLWPPEVSGFLGDLAVSSTFALLINAVTRSRRDLAWLASSGRIHATLANFSFSLYVLHVPLVTVLVLLMYGKQPMLDPSSAPHALVYAGICGAVVAASFAFAALTERQTVPVRLWLERRLSRKTLAGQ